MNNKFSENLKKIRKDHNLSQEQLADELGVSRQAISKWESSLAYPEMDKIIALCDKFNLNIDDLLNKDIREIKGEEETKNKLNKTIDDILNFITDVISLFSNMSFKSKLKCIFEQFVIMGLLFIVSTIIVEISSMIFDNILIFLPEKLNYFIENLLISFVIIFCIIASIIIIIHIFKTRYLNYYIKLKNNSDDNLDNITTEDDEKVKKDEIIDKNNKISFKNNEDKIIIRDPSHSEYGFINGLFKFIVGVIKIFSLIISIALCFFLTGLFVGFISSFLLYKTGLFFIGLLLFLLSLAVIDIILILVLFNFIFNRKNNKKKMIWSFIVSLIISGISCGFILIGSLNFEVLGFNETMIKTVTEEYQMDDVLSLDLFNYGNIDYIESDIDNIKIEYSINKFCNLKHHHYNDQNNYVYVNCDKPIKLVKEFINNLNDKKIIPIDDSIESIKIYTTKENIETIKNNWK